MRERVEDRLFEALPQHHRALDVEEGRPLEALMRLLARELEIVEADIDTLYDNWFIETSEAWVIPYIGALVGAQPLRQFGGGGGGLRAHVANTLAYRRSKGAAAALEQMARDVTGWGSIGVEFFQRLVVSQNLNHPRPTALGTASIHRAEDARMTGGPFEVATHTAAAGPVVSPSGRYNIPNFGIFAWRLQAYAVGFLSSELTGYLGGPQPRRSTIGPGFRRFDPLGADRALFNRPHPDVDLAERTSARHVPSRLDRRVLHDDLEALRRAAPGGGEWFRDPPVVQVRLAGSPVPPERLHVCNLEDRPVPGGITWKRPAAAGEVFFDPELGRLSLHPDNEDEPVETAYAYGAALDVGAGPQDRRPSVGQWWDEFMPEGADPPFRIGVSSRPQEVASDPNVVASLSAAIAGWNAQVTPGARGIITILDSATYAQSLTGAARVIDIQPSSRLAIVAGGWPAREVNGFLQREPDRIAPLSRRPHILSSLRVRGSGATGKTPGSLVLDGLLIEGEVRIEDGELGELQLRHTTCGASAGGLAEGVRVLGGNELLRLLVDHGIVGKIDMQAAAGGVAMHDSILGEDRVANSDTSLAPLLLDAGESDLEIARCTIFGRIVGRELEAENSIFQGKLTIARRQRGCVRFSYVPPESRTPAQYRCAPALTISEEASRLGRDLNANERSAILARVRPQFASSLFGADTFGTLALTCPTEIAESAENGAAMGVGFVLGEPFRRANLRDALDEYLPFGLEAGLIFVT